MNRQKIVLRSLALGLASALGLGFVAARLRSEAGAELAGLRAKAPVQAAAIRSLENSIATIDRKAATPNQATAKPPTIPKFQPYRPPLTDTQLWAADPELQRLYLLSERSRIAREYAPLLATLQLSPEQTARFQEIYATHTADRLDRLITYESLDAARRNGPAIGIVNKREIDRFNAALLELLGEDGVRQKNDYERTLSARTLVDKFAGDVAFSDPLTAGQADRLIRLIAESGASYRDKKMSLLDAVDYDGVKRDAAEFLSAAQLAQWNETEQLPRWQAVENNSMRDARSRVSPATPGQSAAK